MKSFPIYVHIFGKDLLSAFSKLFYLQSCVSTDQWKTLCSKDLTISLIDILMNNFIYDSHKFTYKFAFIPFLPFRRVPKQEPNSQQVRGLVTRNISVLFVYSDSRYTSKACRIQYNFINNLFFNICLYCSSMVSQNSFIIIFERILCFSFMAFHFAWF